MESQAGRPRRWILYIFCRMLAKMGHAYAVATLGLGLAQQRRLSVYDHFSAMPIFADMNIFRWAASKEVAIPREQSEGDLRCPQLI